jgi:hypothetical protein
LGADNDAKFLSFCGRSHAGRKYFMHRLSLLILLLAFLFAFPNSPVTGAEKRILKETEGYAFSVSPEWRELNFPGLKPKFLFEGSGTTLPPLYQNHPLILTVAVLEIPASSLEEVKNEVLKTYSNFEDRVWEPDHRPTVKKIKLKDGGEAYFMATRFFRTTKGLYQNRYELVAYSHPQKTGVVLSVSIQHGDQDYRVEEKLDFRGKVVDPLFSSFTLKSAPQ